MIICSCNALSDAAIRLAIALAEGRVAAVYAQCGCAAKCGACTAVVLGMLREAAKTSA